MKKLITLSIILLLIVNLSFSQTENNDNLSNQIEELKQEIRSKGLANLDKIEGIYEFKRIGGPYGWTPEWLNKTTTEYTYLYIIHSYSPNTFEIFEYEAYYGDFVIQDWTIKKEGNKYLMRGYGKDFDHTENEITFIENKANFKQESKYKTGNMGITYTFESIKKIYPSSLEDNIFKTGTGFFISTLGYIVTNYHVVENANNIYATNEIFTRSLARLVFFDKFNDIALLKVDTSLKNIPYNIFTGDKEIGNNVFTLGYPFIQSMGKEVKLTNGIINSNSGFENDTRYYQFSAEIQPGNSGGPLFDSEGNIIGLVSAKHNKATNAGYALKSKFIVDFIKLNDPSILKKNVSTFKNLNLTSKYKILKDYILLLEIE